MLNNILILLLFSFCNIFPAQTLYSRPSRNKENLYGLRDAYDKWILTPRYKYIGDFYDYDFKNVYDYAIFKEMRNDNGIENIKTGLLNNKGEILIPSQYFYLSCDKGLCLAFDNNEGGKKIVDFNNNIVEESHYTIFKIRDSIIFFKKDKEQYFKKVGSEKKYGPFKKLDFDEKEKIIYAEKNDSKKLINYDGNILIEDAKINDNYKSEFLFADDIYIKELNEPGKSKKITFANAENKNTFGEYVRIDVSKDRKNFLCCLRTSHGRGFEECHGTRFSIFEIIQFLKKGEIIERENKKYIRKNNKIALVNKQGKIISKFYDYKDSSNRYYFDLYETFNNKTEFLVLDDFGKEIFRSNLPIFYYEKDFQIVFDKNEYFGVFKEKKNKIADKVKKPMYVNYSSPNSDIVVISGGNKRYFLNNKGKIKENKKRINNFYNNRSLYITKENSLIIINEKLKEIKKLEGKFYGVQEIDQNGLAIVETNRNSKYSLLDIKTGKLIIEGEFDQIENINELFYKLSIRIKIDSDSYTNKNIYIDKTGKIFVQDLGLWKNYYSYIIRDNYFYIKSFRNIEYNNDIDRYFFDKHGNFIGKNVLNYFDDDNNPD